MYSGRVLLQVGAQSRRNDILLAAEVGDEALLARSVLPGEHDSLAHARIARRAELRSRRARCGSRGS